MRAVAGGAAPAPAPGRGRWVWGLSGLVTVALLAVPCVHLITTAGDPGDAESIMANVPSSSARTVIVTQPVTSVTVQSYGSPVQVTTGPVRHIEVTEMSSYGKGASAGSATVTQSVSGSHLFLADPACSPTGYDCAVSFALTVPPGVTVTAMTDGGPLTVSGVAGANLDSGGGLVRATGIQGPLTVRTEGAPLLIDGLVGALNVDTGNAPLIAEGVDATTVTVSTDGGGARIAFAAAPDSVTVSTDGGAAFLTMPGGPYALAADSDGGPESVGIATDPTAGRSLTVSTGGAPLRIEPAPGR
jgi:hypothetical protein